MSPHHGSSATQGPKDLKVIKSLLPYLWEFKGRVMLAMAFLITAKLANVGLPLALKQIIDSLDSSINPIAILPLALLLAYGALRLANSLFNELRDAIFAKVTQRAVRRIALKVFRHLHTLALRFHLERKTGGVSRDIERGTRGISFLLNFMIFNILPTLFEIGLVAIILFVYFDAAYALITFGSVVTYIIFTMWITEWRMKFRREMNNMDSQANTKAIDSLLNYETVKYFGNESFEARRYDENLQAWEKVAVKNQTSLSALNFGQGAIIAISITLLMSMAAQDVVDKNMTIGDLVMINAYLMQLFMPLNFLGFVYREIKHSLADMEKMFNLLNVNREVEDKEGAKELVVGGGEIRFEQVGFSYQAERTILHDVSFTVEAGKKVAVVGHSGAGKSTLSRLLFRFYDIDSGRILINNQDIRQVTQSSLRAAIGIVPQDTVLFNDSIYYNIAYARPEATKEEVIEAAKMAHIHDFIEKLPDGYESTVGERGLKLSGGEKQRVAIARTILKRPRILLFDEATSSLDSKSEKAILTALEPLAADHTTLVIAHRLSTIVDADKIIVMDEGEIVEQGTHRELLDLNNRYATMWQLQQQEKQSDISDPQ